MNIKERSSNTTLPKIKGQKAVVYDAIRYRHHVPPEFKMEFKYVMETWRLLIQMVLHT